jgi:hypothetical protein
LTEDSNFDTRTAVSKPVDEELPLKFKRFGKTMKLALHEEASQASINSATKSASVRHLKQELGKMSQ